MAGPLGRARVGRKRHLKRFRVYQEGGAAAKSKKAFEKDVKLVPFGLDNNLKERDNK